MSTIIGFLNTIFWQCVLIYGLLAVGLYFTFRLRFLQIVHFGELIRSVIGKRSVDASGISPLQALMVSLASRVGVGNLTGVAVALYLGGQSSGCGWWRWSAWRPPMRRRRSPNSTRRAVRMDSIGAVRQGNRMNANVVDPPK